MVIACPPQRRQERHRTQRVRNAAFAGAPICESGRPPAASEGSRVGAHQNVGLVGEDVRGINLLLRRVALHMHNTRACF